LPPEQVATIKTAILSAYDKDNALTIEEGHLNNAKSLLAMMQTAVSGFKSGATSGIFEVGQIDIDQLSATVAGSVVKATRAITFDDPPATA
jgi:hypothetical protein